MDKIDSRTLPVEALNERRRRAPCAAPAIAASASRSHGVLVFLLAVG